METDGVEHAVITGPGFDRFGGLNDRLTRLPTVTSWRRVLCAGEQRVAGCVDTDGDGPGTTPTATAPPTAL